MWISWLVFFLRYILQNGLEQDFFFIAMAFAQVSLFFSEMKRASKQDLKQLITKKRALLEDLQDEIACLQSKKRCFPFLQQLEEDKDTRTIYVTNWDHFEEMESYLPSGIIFENAIKYPLHYGKAFHRVDLAWLEWDGDTSDMPHVGLCLNKEPLSPEIQDQFRLQFKVIHSRPPPEDCPDEDKWDSGKRICGTFFQRVGLIGHKDIIAQFIEKIATISDDR